MLCDIRLMAIIRAVNPRFINEIAAVLSDNGINALEVSLSDPQMGFECIRQLMKAGFQEKLHIGAGTVTQKSQVDHLVHLKVPFILTPGYDDELTVYALEKGLEVLPGVLTPSDVQAAVKRGLRLLKLFPADAFGPGYIKSLKGPFPQTDYMAVGGVGESNLKDFLDRGFAGAAIGNNLVPQQAGSEDIKEIAKKARAYAAIALE